MFTYVIQSYEKNNMKIFSDIHARMRACLCVLCYVCLDSRTENFKFRVNVALAYLRAFICMRPVFSLKFIAEIYYFVSLKLRNPKHETSWMLFLTNARQLLPKFQSLKITAITKTAAFVPKTTATKPATTYIQIYRTSMAYSLLRLHVRTPVTVIQHLKSRIFVWGSHLRLGKQWINLACCNVFLFLPQQRLYNTNCWNSDNVNIFRMLSALSLLPLPLVWIAFAHKD